MKLFKTFLVPKVFFNIPSESLKGLIFAMSDIFSRWMMKRQIFSEMEESQLNWKSILSNFDLQNHNGPPLWWSKSKVSDLQKSSQIIDKCIQAPFSFSSCFEFTRDVIVEWAFKRWRSKYMESLLKNKYKAEWFRLQNYQLQKSIFPFELSKTFPSVDDYQYRDLRHQKFRSSSRWIEMEEGTRLEKEWILFVTWFRKNVYFGPTKIFGNPFRVRMLAL